MIFNFPSRIIIYGITSVTGGEDLEDPTLETFTKLINTATEFILGLAALVAMFFIVLGAFNYVAGYSVEEKQKGKTIIGYAIGGLVVVAISWIIIHTILVLFGQ